MTGNRLIHYLRSAAYLGAIPGLLLALSATLAAWHDVRQSTLAIAAMGGALTVTPYILARAVEAWWDGQ